MSSRCSSKSSNKQVIDCPQSPESSKSCQLDTELGSASPVMQDQISYLQFPIYIESMTGTTFKLDVFPSDTIQQIKEQLENTEGIPVCDQHLIWHNKELTNENTIEGSSLGFGARLQLVLDLTTGPISGTPLTIDSKEDEQNNEELYESRPLTILLFQNGDQIKLISITTNKTNASDQNPSNYLNSEENYLSNSLTTERSESRQEEDRRIKNKINEIQNKLKSLELKRKENNSDAKQGIIRKETKNSEKLPHLDPICDKSGTKDTKTNLSSGLHLPPISIDSKVVDNSLNESTRLEKQYKFIKQVLMQTSIDANNVLYQRRHSLTSNTRIRFDEEINKLEDMLHNKRDNLITKLRPLTAPAVNSVSDNNISLMNKLSGAKPGANFLSKHRNSAKTNRLKSGRRLPPIVNNSKKKVNKIRCSLCRIKLGIVNRYKCRCGFIFCAKHRYSETHFCSYDYKEEGIKIIRKNNPIVLPEKLPKI